MHTTAPPLNHPNDENTTAQFIASSIFSPLRCVFSYFSYSFLILSVFSQPMHSLSIPFIVLFYVIYLASMFFFFVFYSQIPLHHYLSFSLLTTVTLAPLVKLSMPRQLCRWLQHPYSEKGVVCNPDLVVPGREAKDKAGAEVKETQCE